MNAWQESLLTEVQNAKSDEELFQILARDTRQLGFEHLAYGLRLPFPLSSPRTVIYNDYPEEWQTKYTQQNYISIDPVVAHGQKLQLPLTWSKDVFEGQQDFWDDARSYGVEYGWSQPSNDAHGGRGLLSLVRSGEPLKEEEIASNGWRLVWLAQLGHLYLSKSIIANRFPEVNVSLSKRETEVLRWTADGKTSGEIAEIMNLTERTVNFHISNAMTKLCCVNKTAATVKALLLGMLG